MLEVDARPSVAAPLRQAGILLIGALRTGCGMACFWIGAGVLLGLARTEPPAGMPLRYILAAAVLAAGLAGLGLLLLAAGKGRAGGG